MFKNVEELKEELRRTTGMSPRSIDSLLATPIPDNRAEVGCHIFVLTARSLKKFKSCLVFVEHFQ